MYVGCTTISISPIVYFLNRIKIFVASVLMGTDIRMGPYMFARVLHAVLAGIFTIVFFNMGWGQTAQTVMAQVNPMLTAVVDPSASSHWGAALLMMRNWFVLFGGVVVLALVWQLFRKAKIVAWSARTPRR
jgi:hypothetical protein